MLEISNPTAPFAHSLSALFFKARAKARAKAWPEQECDTPAIAQPVAQPARVEDKAGLSVTWARHLSEVREAQALRYDVFAGEMGAKLKTSLDHPKHDIDLFDDYCEHLIVRDLHTAQVVGTYRLLTPVQAKRVGCFYTDTEFDLTRLRDQRDGMVELGRSCVHQDFRHGGVIMSLGRELFQFMARNRFEAMIGCASIPLNMGPDVAASLWAKLSASHLAPVHEQVMPRIPLPLEQLDASMDVEPPAMLKGYLRLGTKVLGPPAWDADFNSADLPVMARMSDLSPRYKKHFQLD